MEKTKNYPQNYEKEATLDDFVFKNKNHEYGAFDLRRSYLKTINRAFFIGSAVFVFGLLVPSIYGKLKPKDLGVSGLIKLEKILPPPVEAPPKVELPPPPVEAPKVNTVKSLEMVITAEVDPKEELPPTNEQLETAKPGTETVIADPGNVEPVIDETNKKVEVVTIAPEPEEVILNVQQIADFQGGNSAMAKFLQNNLHYPPPAQRANISGKVFLSFIVDRNGEISDVTVIKGIGFGCDEEAVRVVNLMPRWNPGKQSGRAVKSRFNLPISFVLE